MMNRRSSDSYLYFYGYTVKLTSIPFPTLIIHDDIYGNRKPLLKI